MSLMTELPKYWMDGAVRALDGRRRGLSDHYPLSEDPPGVTPYEAVYEGGKVKLRHYLAQGKKSHRTPLVFVYALIKRPFILGLYPGRSVMANLTRQGFDVYMVEWIPPARADSWRGFDAYVNQDLANAVRAVQSLTGASKINFAGLLLRRPADSVVCGAASGGHQEPDHAYDSLRHRGRRQSGVQSREQV
jgi:hypothetical protein